MFGSQIYRRPYAGPQDLQVMLDLLRKRPLGRITDFPGFIDLQEMLAVPKIQFTTQLWFDLHDQLVCFAFLDIDQDSAFLVFEIFPDPKIPELENQVLKWVEACIQSTETVAADPFLLDSNTNSENSDRIALLERLGFRRQAGGALHLECSLTGPLMKPEIPAGFTIRPLHGEEEAEDWVRLHRAALGTQNMTREYKLGMMRTPTYDPQMDLVMVAADGTLTAYCVCFINFEENALSGQSNGYTDPIATHPDFQRRGLSKALLLTGLSLLKARGMLTARLGTSCENIAMIHSAESAGFHIIQKVFYYQKPIHFT